MSENDCRHSTGKQIGEANCLLTVSIFSFSYCIDHIAAGCTDAIIYICNVYIWICIGTFVSVEDSSIAINTGHGTLNTRECVYRVFADGVCRVCIGVYGVHVGVHL